MTTYTITGLIEEDVLRVSAVFEGELTPADTAYYSGNERWCDTVDAESAEEAESAARWLFELGGVPVDKTAGMLDEGDTIIYEDDDHAQVTRVGRDAGGDVLLWFDGCDSDDDPAVYDVSAMLRVVPA